MQLEISITPDDIKRELTAELDNTVDQIFNKLPPELPKAARFVVDRSTPAGKRYGNHRASAKGQPFANKSFETYNSFRAERSGKRQVLFSMSGTMQWLEPVVGGYLNRPVLEEAIEISVTNALATSL